jgi:hypothetical protein
MSSVLGRFVAGRDFSARRGLREGMLDVRRSALLKVAEGATSTEEMMRVIPAEYLLPDGQDPL